MRLRFLAISDTHLGEKTSLLSFPHGRQHLWKVLRQPFGSDNWEDNGKLEIEEMVLLGDIPDRTLSSTSEIITHTNAFVQMLGSAATIEKGIYVPGNHDHTLWTDYLGTAGAAKKPSGDLIVSKGNPDSTGGKVTDLLSIFFGHPAGSSWRRIHQEKKFDFAVANPVYATQFKDRTYVFTHGTHFKGVVTSSQLIKKIADYLELDEVLGGIEIESDCDVNKAKNLEELEKIVTPFVDSLWPSSKNNPTSRSDQFWYLLTMLSGKFDKHRAAPRESKIFSHADLSDVCQDRIRRLTTDDDSIKQWQEHFLPHMLKYLEDNCFPKGNISFVYGDTHDGGWGEFSLDSGEEIRIYNCGGWVIHNKEDHPACHLFAVDEDGEEYLLDVSYKNVKVGEDPLLDLAAQDAENRYRNTSRMLRFLLKLVLPG